MRAILAHLRSLTTKQRVVVCLLLPVTTIGSVALALWLVRRNQRQNNLTPEE